MTRKKASTMERLMNEDSPDAVVALDKSRLPIDISDFPTIVQESFIVFNKLNDRYASTDIGPLYTGKELTGLPVLLDIMDIDKRDHRLVLDIVQYLDANAVRQELNRHSELAKKINSKMKTPQ